MIHRSDGQKGAGNSPKINRPTIHQDGLGIRDRFIGFTRQDFVEHFSPHGKDKDIIINRYLSVAALAIATISIVMQIL